jgi:hypothetical protein
MAKRQKRTVGDFVKIKLDECHHAYARVLEKALFAFYDAFTDKGLSLEEIKARPILFKIWVMNVAVTSGRWEIIGNAPLEKNLLEQPYFFKKDPLSPKSLSIYHEGNERPATLEECKNLECAAVWDAEHVEDRLRDHYAGKSNKWVESMRPTK